MEDSVELVVCISSTALFNCTESHQIWQHEGLNAYKSHQRVQMNVPLQLGVGYPLIESLLKLNKVVDKPLIDVVLVSRNDAESGQRIIRSIEICNLDITRMSFTGGTDVTNYLLPWKCDLFLSTEEDQVKKVLAGTNSNLLDSIAAGLIYNPISETVPAQSDSIPNISHNNNSNNSFVSYTSPTWPKDQVRIVFDGDGVLFSNTQSNSSSNYDLENERRPLPKGPLQAFALKLQKVRQALGDSNGWRLRTFLILSRNDKNTKRVPSTLKEWGLQIDETHILGGREMTPFLRAIDPAIFFNNSIEYIEQARQHVPAAHVPFDGPIVSADINEVVYQDHSLLQKPMPLTQMKMKNIEN